MNANIVKRMPITGVLAAVAIVMIIAGDFMPYFTAGIGNFVDSNQTFLFRPGEELPDGVIKGFQLTSTLFNLIKVVLLAAAALLILKRTNPLSIAKDDGEEGKVYMLRTVVIVASIAVALVPSLFILTSSIAGPEDFQGQVLKEFRTYGMFVSAAGAALLAVSSIPGYKWRKSSGLPSLANTTTDSVVR